MILPEVIKTANEVLATSLVQIIFTFCDNLLEINGPFAYVWAYLQKVALRAFPLKSVNLENLLIGHLGHFPGFSCYK